MVAHMMPTQLTGAQFERISRLVGGLCGIKLAPGKEDLVAARLAKRLRALKMSSFEDYIAFLERDHSGEEMASLVDVITTNYTAFFRESQHFDYLRTRVLPDLQDRGHPIRFWSAGCSTGEEPYSIAIMLMETIPDLALGGVRILATDISGTAIKKARMGLYEESELTTLPDHFLKKYFVPAEAASSHTFRVSDRIKSLVQFARLNLVRPWPMQGPFDVILCRNVMIYFEQSTRITLVQRFWELLDHGGYLLIGHSESLTGIPHQFGYLRPSTYVKRE